MLRRLRFEPNHQPSKEDSHHAQYGFASGCEHYEIASYGTIRVWANMLGKTDIGSLFEDTLEEEKEADRKLTEIATRLKLARPTIFEVPP